MRTRIKFCGINKPSDFAYAASLGADAVGLVFYQASPRYIDIDNAHTLLTQAAQPMKIVALFMDASHDYITNVLSVIKVDYIQFHGNESPTFCTSFSLPYIKAIPMADSEQAYTMIAAHRDRADILLLDGHCHGRAGGSGIRFDWNKLPEIDNPLFIAGGLTPENVGQAISACHPQGVDVSSGVESSCGIKDPIKMKAFIAAVVRADYEHL